MVTAVRLTPKEQDDLRKKCIEINKILIKENRMPLKESELVHKILEKSITYVRVGASGDLILDVD
mgnify:CR=1 FL=1|jgi:hypothetical protein